MQYTKGKVTCQVTLSGARMDKLVEIMRLIPRRVRVSSVEFAAAPKNRNTVTFRAEYGPVWGGFEYDIRRAVRAAMRKSGSEARLDVKDLQRQVTERRNFSGAVDLA